MSERYVSVRVKGEFALFTRPENKVERVTYPVPTPSAARGILEAIYWHPEFTWAIREIHVLAPVQTFGILRNEVNSKMTSGGPFFADDDPNMAVYQKAAASFGDDNFVFVAYDDPELFTKWPTLLYKLLIFRNMPPTGGPNVCRH